jgi:hypothetical protein
LAEAAFNENEEADSAANYTQILTRCWSADPHCRPTAAEVEASVRALTVTQSCGPKSVQSHSVLQPEPSVEPKSVTIPGKLNSEPQSFEADCWKQRATWRSWEQCYICVPIACDKLLVYTSKAVFSRDKSDTRTSSIQDLGGCEVQKGETGKFGFMLHVTPHAQGSRPSVSKFQFQAEKERDTLYILISRAISKSRARLNDVMEFTPPNAAQGEQVLGTGLDIKATDSQVGTGRSRERWARAGWGESWSRDAQPEKESEHKVKEYVAGLEPFNSDRSISPQPEVTLLSPTRWDEVTNSIQAAHVDGQNGMAGRREQTTPLVPVVLTPARGEI